MNIQRWADIAADTTFDYALGETFHYVYTMELDGASRGDLAQCLMRLALQTADYQDAWDTDPAAREKRLNHFISLVKASAAQRLDLTGKRDDLMQRRRAEYGRIKNIINSFENRPAVNNDQKLGRTDIQTLLADHKDMLALQGIPDIVTARAAFESALTLSFIQGPEAFSRFCKRIVEPADLQAEVFSAARTYASILAGAESGSARQIH